jgi:DNA-binding LacI/PurR family transcriptional regulator
MKNQTLILKSKFEQVYDILLKRIENEFTIGGRLPTETELASAFSVNRMTVAKVMSVLKQEGYVRRKQGLGTILIAKPQHTKADGIISFLPYCFDMVRDPFFTPLTNAVADEALRQGLIISWVGGAADRKNDLLRIKSLFGGKKYQGVIIIDPRLDVRKTWHEYFHGLSEPPAVWVSVSPKREKNINCVVVDQEIGVRLGLDFLFGQGCRRIGFLSRALDTYDRQERHEAFKRIHAGRNLTLNDEQIILNEAKSAKEAGYLGFKRLFESAVQLDAVFVGDQGLLAGLETLCPDRKLPSTRQISMVVFDYEFGGVFDHLVSASIIQPVEELGRAAVRMLTRLVGGKVKPPLQTILKPRMVVRPE